VTCWTQRRHAICAEPTARAPARRRLLSHPLAPRRAFDAHILRLLPPLDDLDAVRVEARAEQLHGCRRRQSDAEVEKRQQPHRLIPRPERQRDPLSSYTKSTLPSSYQRLPQSKPK
jgi:hypothetical protein